MVAIFFEYFLSSEAHLIMIAQNSFVYNWPPGVGFPIGMILSIFDLQVTPMLPTKRQVNWHFGLEEEAKNTFSGWWPA